MRATVAKWSLVLLCASMGAAIGGGLYEHIVLTPIWSASPPSSFTIIQPETGVPLQRFWIPVHIGITVFVLAALIAAWNDVRARRLLLIGLTSYIVMRVWSGMFFIPEMLAFQQVPPDAPATAALSERVERWTSMTVWREPLDVISFLSFTLGLFWLRRSDGGGVTQ
jgi:hypothetical protein